MHPAKKNILNIAAIALLAWFMGGGSSSYIKLKPMEMKESIPHFGEVNPLKERVIADIEAGVLVEDAASVKKREAFLKAFSVLQGDPCNDENREAYAKLLRPAMIEHFRWPAEEGGKAYRDMAHRMFNADLLSVMMLSIEGGYVRKSDLPLRFRPFIGDLSVACRTDENDDIE